MDSIPQRPQLARRRGEYKTDMAADAGLRDYSYYPGKHRGIHVCLGYHLLTQHHSNTEARTH